MTIIDLIRQEMIKVRGQIAGIAKLLVDEDENINCMFVTLLDVDYYLNELILIILQILQDNFLELLQKKEILFTMFYPILFRPYPILRIWYQNMIFSQL